jgi:serine/threonine protein phosphatase 1
LANRYVFPDIHGCIKTFQYTFEKVISPNKTDEIYFTGDFINKGPDSKGVLDFLLKLVNEGYHIRSVRGNHEQLLLNAIEDKSNEDEFILKGGLDTLESFSVREAAEIPDQYIRFISDLPFYIELNDYYIVHAGFNFTLSDPFRDLNAMLTIRDFMASPHKLKYKKVIHGHYAKPLQDILYNLIEKKGYVLNIDNGCVYTHREGMGNLFILNLNNLSYHIQPCLDNHNYEDSVSKRRYYQNKS